MRDAKKGEEGKAKNVEFITFHGDEKVSVRRSLVPRRGVDPMTALLGLMIFVALAYIFKMGYHLW